MGRQGGEWGNNGMGMASPSTTTTTTTTGSNNPPAQQQQPPPPRSSTSNHRNNNDEEESCLISPPCSVLVPSGPSSVTAISAISDLDFPPDFLHGQVRYPKINEEENDVVEENEGDGYQKEGKRYAITDDTTKIIKKQFDCNDEIVKKNNDDDKLVLPEDAAAVAPTDKVAAGIGGPVSTIEPLPSATNRQRPRAVHPGAVACAPGIAEDSRPPVPPPTVLEDAASTGQPPPPSGNQQSALVVATTSSQGNNDNGNGNNDNGQHDNSNDQLAIARAVGDEEQGRLLLQAATEVDPNNDESNNNKEGNCCKPEHCGSQAFLIAGGLLLFILGIVVGLTANKGGGGGDTNSNQEVPPAFFTLRPTRAPSMIPSQSPTSSLEFLFQSLPVHTLQALEEFGTPQWKAWDWLTTHRNLTTLEEWRKQQLFAMATLFFALNGENWPQPLRERWIDDSRHECLWYSGGVGAIENGVFTRWEDIGIPSREPCDGLGRFTSLELNFDMPALDNPHIPLEFAMLSSLEKILLLRNFNAPLSNFLPSTLGQLPKFTSLLLNSVNLFGPIPSEIGLYTNLRQLDINSFGTQLTGPIPSEIGRATSLQSLWIPGGRLSGTLPSQIGLMTSLSRLELSQHLLEVPIPSEIGMLSANLEYISLWSNPLRTSIPSTLGMLTGLKVLGLFNTSLTGSIPSQFGRMSLLEAVGMNGNQLTGTLPTEMEQLTFLDSMALQDNLLTGVLPNLSVTSTAWRLDGNQFTGVVPEPLCGYLYCEDCNSATSCDLLETHYLWPGRLVPLDNHTSTDSYDATKVPIMLNIQTDAWPTETEWTLEQRHNNNLNASRWETVEGVPKGTLVYRDYLYSYLLLLDPKVSYKLTILDSTEDRDPWAGTSGYATLIGLDGSILYSYRRQFWPVQYAFTNITIELELSADGNNITTLTSNVADAAF